MAEKKPNFIVKIPIYDFSVMVSFAQTDEELEKALADWETKYEGQKELYEMEDLTNGRACMFECGSLLIRMKKYPIDSRDYGNLQHEIYHIVTFLMDKVGVRFMMSVSCEAYAYLIGYLTQEIYENIDTD